MVPAPGPYGELSIRVVQFNEVYLTPPASVRLISFGVASDKRFSMLIRLAPKSSMQPLRDGSLPGPDAFSDGHDIELNDGRQTSKQSDRIADGIWGPSLVQSSFCACQA